VRSVSCMRRWRTRVSCFGLKSKVNGFSRFDLKTCVYGFLGLGLLILKITVTVFWFMAQNQAGYGLSVASQNQREDEDGVERISRSSGLFHLKESRARVS
jgi:hypothetical protein